MSMTILQYYKKGVTTRAGCSSWSAVSTFICLFFLQKPAFVWSRTSTYRSSGDLHRFEHLGLDPFWGSPNVHSPKKHLVLGLEVAKLLRRSSVSSGGTHGSAPGSLQEVGWERLREASGKAPRCRAAEWPSLPRRAVRYIKRLRMLGLMPPGK